MDYQVLFNIALALVAGLMGVVLRALWESLTALRHHDAKLAEKVARIELLVAGEYITKHEFTRVMEGATGKLDRIEDKLNRSIMNALSSAGRPSSGPGQNTG